MCTFLKCLKKQGKRPGNSELMKKNFREKLNRLRLDILYLNSYQGVVALAVLSLAISYFYSIEVGEPTYNPGVNTIWLPLALCSFIIKFISTVLYHKRTYHHENEILWRLIFYFTTVLSGLSIGSSIIFVSGMSNTNEKMFIILLISAITSGSASVLATSLTSFTIYNSLVISPYLFHFLTSDKHSDHIIGYLGILFISTIFLTAYSINRSLSRSLSLKIENDLIIEKLEQSEDKFAKSFYSGIAPMAMVDYKTAKIIDANNALVELLEYPRDEIIGKTPYDLYLNDRPDKLIDLVIDAVNAGHLTNREITLRTSSGKIKHCFITVESFKAGGSSIAYIMLQDFTERLEYENKLKIERERAEQAAEAKSRFLASMSHEIRTPMNTILGMTGLALMSDNEDERTGYLNTVKDSAEYLLVLINDILDLSRLESGRIEIDVIDVDLPKLTDSVYRFMEFHAIKRKLGFTIDIEADVPVYIKCAPERIKQILINLIGNALKFTHEGSVNLNVSLSDGKNYPGCDNSGSYIEFTVTDTGIGIPEDKLDIIFESFTQADSSTFRKYGGTGLGLSISRQLIRLMGGEIRVDSTPGMGSRFSFIIPLIQGVRPDETYVETQQGISSSVKKILIAEDNALNSRLIEAYMKRLGHDYTLAENGEEVIKLLKEKNFDAILMDLEMPLMDGYQAMKLIREGAAGESNRNIQIHAMSAHVMKSTIDKCLDEGFNTYITKPVDLKKLAGIL